MAFHRLLDDTAGARWRQKSPTCAWTVGEVLVHLTWALEQLPQEVAAARRRQGHVQHAKVDRRPGSFWIIRRQARKSDPASLRRRYDTAMDAVLAALETVPDSDWGLGARFYGERFYTVAGLFATPGRHQVEHATGM